ncbi:MAG TPA: hypothetical protein VEJ88_03580, partial [Dissulfurispiraceae bacterium]|nr:hypothetical protein [Dissulfurispiraceae bacterium]
LVNNLPDLFWPEDLQKGKRKEDYNATKIADYLYSPFTEEIKKGIKTLSFIADPISILPCLICL